MLRRLFVSQAQSPSPNPQFLNQLPVSDMLRRLFFCQEQSSSPDPRVANQLPVFNNADTVAAIIDNITDLATLCNFASVFPIARFVVAQYPRSILAHTVSNDLVLAFVASTEYETQGPDSMEPFLKQKNINKGCLEIPRILNGGHLLESLIVIDDAIERFSAFLRINNGYAENFYKMDVKPGLIGYLSSLFRNQYYLIPFQHSTDKFRAKEALWHLEIYNAHFLTGGGGAYGSSPKNLEDQAHYLHVLDPKMLWTLYYICQHFAQTLNSPTLHDTQHRLYEILKLGHGVTRSQRQPGRPWSENKGFFEKYLAYQLSLALPEMLRVFHYQWSGDLRGPAPDAPNDGTNRPSPREVSQQRREDWTLLWGSDAYEELDEEWEVEFISKKTVFWRLTTWFGLTLGVLWWTCIFFFSYCLYICYVWSAYGKQKCEMVWTSRRRQL